MLLVILCELRIYSTSESSVHQQTADTNLTVGGGADGVPLQRDLGEGLDTIVPGVGHGGFPHAIDADRL